MVLQGSGAISMSQIMAELGKTANSTQNLSGDLYKGFSGLSSNRASFSDFYGKQQFTSGLVFDFNAKNNVTYDTNTNVVSAWTDSRVGITSTLTINNNNNVTYVSNAINNLPGLNIIGGSIFTTSTLTSTTTTRFTLFVVLKYRGGGGSMVQYFATDGNWLSGCIHLFINQLSINVGGANDRSMSAPSNDTYNIITIWNTSTTSTTYRLNGVLSSTPNIGYSSIRYTKINLGGWSGDPGRYLNAYFGEFIFFNRSLTQAEVDDIEAYLSYKWNIGIGSTPTVSTTAKFI